MSKKTRNTLLLIFIILFIILTTLFSLYASGYKFNLSWPIRFNRLLQRTGMLIVETKPTKAIVYLNNKPQHNPSLKPWRKDYLVTPAKIKNILPGEYELRLENEGYWPFIKKININSGETTFIKEINLFLKTTPTLVLPCSEDSLIISPGNKYIYSQNAKKIITLKTEEVKELEVPNEAPSTWLDNNKLLVAGVLFNPLKNTTENYADLIGANADSWRFETITGYLYYKNKNTINLFKPDNRTSTLLLSGGDYLDYKPKNNQLFILVKKDGQIFLEKTPSTNSQKESWLLPTTGDYSFSQNLASYLTVYDKKNQTLYLFNETKIGDGPLIIKNIKNWALMDINNLVYTNDFEIYTFDLTNHRSTLITRRGTAIKDIIWNAEKNYLIFSEKENLNVFDFKNQNVTSLLAGEEIISPVLNTKDNTLYFWANINEQEGIYKILL